VLVKKMRSPAPGNIDEDIDFICKSFGYFSLRDKQDSAGRIFRLLVKEACGNDEGISSDDIANELTLSRGAIVHHLNSFISTGLVIKESNRYRLRSGSLQKSIEEIKDDIDRIFKQITKIAEEIDEKLGNYYR
jgi:predicted transcriptional regulator